MNDCKVRVEMTAHGVGHVFVNDVEMKGVTEIRFRAIAHETNLVELTLFASQVQISGVADLVVKEARVAAPVDSGRAPGIEP